MTLEASHAEVTTLSLVQEEGLRASFATGGKPLYKQPAFMAVILLLILLTAIYYRIFFKLVSDWYTLPDFSHGFLVPFFAALLLWEKRAAIRALPPKPSWAGAPLLILGLFTLLVGDYGAVLFLSRISFLLIVAAIVLLLYGGAMLREVSLILFVLLLAIPIPAIIFNQVTVPLQFFASKVASSILPLFGVPILREGNVIQLPAMQLEVAEACSGIRSLMSLFTLAVVYGHFIEHTHTRRALLALASIPIAVAANAIRIVGTGLCVQFWNPDKALGFFHEFSGWVMFVVSLACLYLVHLAMRLVDSRRRYAL